MSFKLMVAKGQTVTEFEPTEMDKKDLQSDVLENIPENVKEMLPKNNDVELESNFKIKEVNGQGVYIVKLSYCLVGPKSDIKLIERKFMREE